MSFSETTHRQSSTWDSREAKSQNPRAASIFSRQTTTPITGVRGMDFVPLATLFNNAETKYLFFGV